jgi:hypothetical protein
MHPITALMLSRAIEADRRRELERRRHRPARTEPIETGRGERRRWTIRIPRPGLAASKA